MTVPWTRTLSDGYAPTCRAEHRPAATTAGNHQKSSYTKVSHKAQFFHHNCSTCICQRTQRRLSWSHLTLMTSLLQPPVWRSKRKLSTLPVMQRTSQTGRSVEACKCHLRSPPLRFSLPEPNSHTTPHEFLYGSPLPLDRSPTNLGVTFDP